jgi:NADH:ubiquinone oxidoreductase subunit F (NADH-binding)
VTSVRETTPVTGRYRLLGHPTDLAGHVATLGPAPLPSGALGWRERFVSMLESSGLAGRGGAGFPTGIKLAVAHAAGSGGTIVVNAMEGEPSSDKDKLLLTRSPHLVLDGAQLLAAAMGARHVAVCVPAGRDHVAAAVTRAMSERVSARYPVVTPEELLRPPDRFIAGEESALVHWVETGDSLPSFRPDKGTALRLGRRGALVHNAETLAHVAMIARTGPDAFRAHGLVEDPGTSLVTIGGAVQQPGVVEIDRGTPLIDIASRATPTGRPQALLVGGYGGTWVGPEHFTTPYASLSLRAIGATAGVGIVVVLGQDACGLTESARVAHYLAGQSAGQCGPCVYGLPAIADDMTRLARGNVDAGLMGRLGRRLREVNGRGACRHPDGAVNLVRSALLVFGADAEAHARGARCAHWNSATQLRFPTRETGVPT